MANVLQRIPVGEAKSRPSGKNSPLEERKIKSIRDIKEGYFYRRPSVEIPSS